MRRWRIRVGALSIPQRLIWFLWTASKATLPTNEELQRDDIVGDGKFHREETTLYVDT